MERREFLRQAGVVAGGALLSPVSAGASWRGSGERVTVGVIGCGGMGSAHVGFLLSLREQGLVNIGGVCDVFTKRVAAAAAQTGAKPFADYRKLLDDKSIDAVVIATPDHWHAKITMDAMEAGKDVYCEKPMTYWRDLKTPQEVVKAVGRTKRVVQVGTQYMADDIWDLCNRRIRAGALGKLIHAQASDCRNGPLGVYSPKSNDPDAKPGQTLDWNMWLGSAPKRPYDPGRYFAFRSFWDYSGGTGTDFFPHLLTPLITALGVAFPRRVTASGGLYYWSDGREVPDIFSIAIEYPEGPVVTLLASLATDANVPMLIRGQQATMTFTDPGAVIEPQVSGGATGKREEVARTRAWSHDEHWKDFLRCIKTRERPRSHVELGYHVMTALHMGIHAYLSGRAYVFDPATETAKPA